MKKYFLLLLINFPSLLFAQSVSINTDGAQPDNTAMLDIKSNSKGLKKEYDEMLEGQRFLRVHKSHLVNPAHIQAYDRQGILQMSDNSKVEVARRKKEYLQQALAGKV